MQSRHNSIQTICFRVSEYTIIAIDKIREVVLIVIWFMAIYYQEDGRISLKLPNFIAEFSEDYFSHVI